MNTIQQHHSLNVIVSKHSSNDAENPTNPPTYFEDFADNLFPFSCGLQVI